MEPRGISSIQTESVSDLLGRGEPSTLCLISSMMMVGKGLVEGRAVPSLQWEHLKEVAASPLLGPVTPPAPAMSPV